MASQEIATLTIVSEGAVSYSDAMQLSFKEREMFFKTLQKLKGDPNKQFL